MGDKDAFLIFQMRTQDMHTLVVKIEVFLNMEHGWCGVEVHQNMQLKLSELPSTNGPLPTNFSRDFLDFSFLLVHPASASPRATLATPSPRWLDEGGGQLPRAQGG